MGARPHNRRRVPRYTAGGLEAMVLFDHHINSAHVLDLSVGGALLRTAHAPPVGVDAEITFSTGRHSVIRATARVVQRDRATQSIRICFVALRGHHRARLQRLVDLFEWEDSVHSAS